MEDELAASIAIQGAVWGGAKAFTVTSGPGFSLMMEHIGYAAITETPCVFVNVQRGGPSTGLPTLPAQADMMQARWGSHGDYGIIALCPNSPQECFDLTITGFNLAEEFRVPVMMMLDECVGHMTEKVVIPPADQIEVLPRRYNKPATVISGFPTGVDLEEITRSLKNRLATGGSVVDGEVYLQGDHRTRIRDELGKLGFDPDTVEISNAQLPKRGRHG
jgi:pyruvate/2-oxoacid:ferredoxin oxidoreductase alpha subunit